MTGPDAPHHAPRPEPTLALMVHNAQLFTWLVRTGGKALAIMTLIPVLGALAAAASGEPALLGVSGVLAVFVLLGFLSGATAPFPDRDVTDLLDGQR